MIKVLSMSDANKPLHSPWSVWYHSITDSSWTNGSYKELFKVTNLYELYSLRTTIQRHHLQNGMFFVMRDDIFPTWEDPDNREGCCVSFKVGSDVLKDQWDFIVNQVVGEDILQGDDLVSQVNGISVAPKKEFNIIKIWLRSNVAEYTTILKEYEPYFTRDKALVKKHEIGK